MTFDTTIAESLVANLEAASLSKSATIELTVDPYIESQAFPDALIQVGFANTVRSMEGRSEWRVTDAVLTLLIAGKQTNYESGSLAAMKDWLTFVEEVLAIVQDSNVNGGRINAIESDDRYDADKLRADGQFRSVFTISYTPT